VILRFVSGADDLQAAADLERVGVELPDGLELRWLGVSGYQLTYEGVSLFVDPYVSRVPLRALLLRRTALPDGQMIARYANAPGRSPAFWSVTRTSTTPSMRRRWRAGTRPRRMARRRWCS
jgi:hypothetical protein